MRGEVYMEKPPDFVTKWLKCWLRWFLYRLKESQRACFGYFNLQKFGQGHSEKDHVVFSSWHYTMLKCFCLVMWMTMSLLKWPRQDWATNLTSICTLPGHKVDTSTSWTMITQSSSSVTISSWTKTSMADRLLIRLLYNPNVKTLTLPAKGEPYVDPGCSLKAARFSL